MNVHKHKVSRTLAPIQIDSERRIICYNMYIKKFENFRFRYQNLDRTNFAR